MTYLLDSNVWLELLFEQERADDVRRFLDTVPMAQIAMSEFSVYSIGIALARSGLENAFVQFVSDTLEGTALDRIRLDTTDLKEIMHVRKRFRLDFDDAYQYVAAEKPRSRAIALSRSSAAQGAVPATKRATVYS